MAKRIVAEGAIILAGGPSSRMGEPKALVEIEGVPMIVRVMEALYESGIKKAISSFKNSEQANSVLNSLGSSRSEEGLLRIKGSNLLLKTIFDDELSQGGNSAVRGMSGPVFLADQLGWQTIQMAPCDVPFLDARLPPLLYSKLSGRKDCAAPLSNSGLEPLLICANTKPLNIALNDASLAAHEVIAKMKTVEVSYEEWGSIGITDRCFTNVNSKDDLNVIN